MTKLWMLLLVPLLIAWQPETLEQAEKRYGKIDTKSWIWPDADRWLVQPGPKAPKSHWVNVDMWVPLVHVLEELSKRHLLKEIQSSQGIYVPRAVRGTTDKVSAHSYALALDLIPYTAEWSSEFIAVWERHGFCWGGRWKKPDPIHFSWAKWECAK